MLLRLYFGVLHRGSIAHTHTNAHTHTHLDDGEDHVDEDDEEQRCQQDGDAERARDRRDGLRLVGVRAVVRETRHRTRDVGRCGQVLNSVHTTGLLLSLQCLYGR